MRYLETDSKLRNDGGVDEVVPSLVPESFFPVIDRERKRSRIYLDSAATTQKPSSVIQRVEAFYREEYAGVHRGIHLLSAGATEAFEAARIALGRFIDAAEPGK
jgi:selenocysteine lyase/cysteine desulfurase